MPRLARHAARTVRGRMPTLEFFVACAVIIAVGFVVNLVQNWIDHRRYEAAHKRLRATDRYHDGGVTRIRET